MPNRAQRRSGDTPTMGFRVTVAGFTYEIELDNMSALDEADFTRTLATVTGESLTFFEAFQRVSTYTVAAFVWLERRRTEKQLTIQEVMKEVRMRDLNTFETLGEEDDEETQVPETPVDGRNPELSGGPSAPSSLGSPQSTG